MWKRSFVATSVALGGSVDDALASLASGSGGALADAELAELVTGLRSSARQARTSALASAIRDVMVAIDGTTLA